MKALPFDCSYTQVWVSPRNWATTQSKALLKKQWYIQFYYYDPLFKEKYPNGYPYRKKFNNFKTIEERRAAIKYVLEQIPILLEQKAFNPITKKYMIEQAPEPEPEETENNFEIGPYSFMLDALDFAYKNINVGKTTYDDLRLVLTHFGKSAKQLRYDLLSIGEVKRRHVKFIIDNLEKTDGEFSGHKFNKYRTYLSILFNVLLDYEAVESNIIKDIRKRKVIRNIREVLTTDQRVQVKNHLSKNQPEFWRFTQIFFHSGGRKTELLAVKVKDVDLVNQKYRVLIKKGKDSIWVERVIKDIALPVWQEVLLNANSDDFVFSVGLTPGAKLIRADQINKRWKRCVKDPLGITADFYSLKHLNLDETVSILSLNDAAAMANHKSIQMVSQVYAVGEKQRQSDRLRSLNNPFA